MQVHPGMYGGVSGAPMGMGGYSAGFGGGYGGVTLPLPHGSDGRGVGMRPPMPTSAGMHPAHARMMGRGPPSDPLPQPAPRGPPGPQLARSASATLSKDAAPFVP